MLLYAAAFAAAEALERNAGSRAALPAFRTLATSATEPERTRAILAGLRCARAAADLDALDAFVTLWPTAQGGHFDELRGLVLTLFASPAGRGKEFAYRLAQAEATRTQRALAGYLYARVAEAVRPDTARAIYEEARTRATAEGDERVYAASTARLLTFLTPDESETAATLAKSIDSALVDDAGKLAIAGALIGAKSRFSRASGFTLLQELLRDARTRTGGAAASALASRALVIAAKAADRLVATATALEIERLRALFAETPDERLRATLVGRLEGALQARAGASFTPENGPASRDPGYLTAFLAARDAYAGTPPSYAPNAVTAATLTALADLQAKRAAACEFALDRLARALAGPDPLGGATNAVSSLLLLTLGHEHEGVRTAAQRVALRFAALGSSPKCGFLLLAKAVFVPLAPAGGAVDGAALAEATRLALLETAFRKAEPHAAEMLFERSIARGWALAETDPEAALSALRRARSLTAPSDPAAR